jgi:hypothetical protein
MPGIYGRIGIVNLCIYFQGITVSYNFIEEIKKRRMIFLGKDFVDI